MLNSECHAPSVPAWLGDSFSESLKLVLGDINLPARLCPLPTENSQKGAFCRAGRGQSLSPD